MAKIKLTKTAVDAATPKDREYELHDTIVPGFMLKVTPFGGKIFMLAYLNNSGVRRKPARRAPRSEIIGPSVIAEETIAPFQPALGTTKAGRR